MRILMRKLTKASQKACPCHQDVTDFKLFSSIPVVYFWSKKFVKLNANFNAKIDKGFSEGNKQQLSNENQNWTFSN